MSHISYDPRAVRATSSYLNRKPRTLDEALAKIGFDRRLAMQLDLIKTATPKRHVTV